jgi:hypothetical protein
MPLRHRCRRGQHHCIDRSRSTSVEQPVCAEEPPTTPGVAARGVLRDGLRLLEQPEPAEVARPEALREAASIGASALDWGELKGFNCIEDLQTYLNDWSKKVIAARWRIKQVVARK